MAARTTRGGRRRPSMPGPRRRGGASRPVRSTCRHGSARSGPTPAGLAPRRRRRPVPGPGPDAPRPLGHRPSGRQNEGVKGRSRLGSSADGTGDTLALWFGRHVAPPSLMNRGLRRPLIALVVAVVVVGAWVGAPLMAAPAEPGRARRLARLWSPQTSDPARRASGADPSARPSPASAQPSASATGSPTVTRAPAPTPRIPRPIIGTRLPRGTARPARRRSCEPPSAPVSSASARNTGSRASRRRSCSQTAPSGAAPPVWPTWPPSER